MVRLERVAGNGSRPRSGANEPMETDNGPESSEGRRWRLAGWASVLVACGLTFFTNLGATKLWDRDEPRNAGCAQEMLARGDWVVPVFNAELRTHKPVLLYWVTMAAYRVWGVNEFAARFGSACAGTITVLLTFFAGQRLWGLRAGWLAAMALASCLMFTVAARAATPDSVLIVCTTTALVAFLGSAFGAHHATTAAGADAATTPAAWPLFPREYAAAGFIYAAMALAVLAKGPVGVVLPCAVIGMYLLIARSSGTVASWFAPAHFVRTLLHMRLGVALLMLAVVALPWYIWVGVRTDGAWLRGFLWEHNVNRAMAPMEGHSGPIIYYPLAMLVGFFPWSIFAVPVSWELWRGRSTPRQRAALVFLLCWVGVYVGLFSLARTKLPSYITPIYPALALLTGWFLDRWLARRAIVGQRWMVAAFGTLLLVGLVVAVALPLAARRYFPGDEWLGLVGAVPILAGAAGCWAVMRDQRAWAVGMLVLVVVMLLALAFGWVAVRVSDHQRYGELVAAIHGGDGLPGRAVAAVRPGESAAENETAAAAQRVRPPVWLVRSGSSALGSGADTHVMSYRYLEPSWVFYLGQPIEAIQPQDGQRVEQRLAEHRRVCLIVAQRDWEQLRQTAPWARSFHVIGHAPYFLRNQELLVVDSAPLVARRPTP